MNRSSLGVWFGWVALAVLLLVGTGRLAAGEDYRNDEPRPPQPVQDISEEEYYELLRLLADTLDQVERNYVKEVTRRELVEAAIQGVIGKLDQYSNYIPPEDVERFRGGIENEFGGIGIQVAIDNGELTITSPIVGTPAYKAGLKSGDIITQIEGESTKGITLDGAVKKLKGEVGTAVSFTVRHKHDGKEETVSVKRQMVRVDSVLGDTRNGDDSWHWLFDDEKKIGYIRITSFSRHTAEDLRTAMRNLNDVGLRGLIVDLRFNPGGLLSSAIEICDMFIAEGVIVSTKGRNTPENPRYAKKAGTYEDFPMAILVNRYSASASEIMSACLQDHQRAVVIGERTWGKGSVQNIINLEEGKSALKLTTAAYHRPSGKNIHRFDGAKETDDWGVRPNDGFDLRFTDDELSEILEYRRLKDIVRQVQGEGDVPNFKDRHLEKAMEYLLAKLGDSPAAEDPRTAQPAPPVPVAEGAS